MFVMIVMIAAEGCLSSETIEVGIDAVNNQKNWSEPVSLALYLLLVNGSIVLLISFHI